MEDLETMLRGQKEDYLLQIIQNKKMKKDLERIYKIGFRFNLRKVEIIYLLKEVVDILDNKESIDITELYDLGEKRGNKWNG